MVPAVRAVQSGWGTSLYQASVSGSPPREQGGKEAIIVEHHDYL